MTDSDRVVGVARTMETSMIDDDDNKQDVERSRTGQSKTELNDLVKQFVLYCVCTVLQC